MDALSAFLDGPRAQDAFLLRSSMDPPWSLRIEDGAPLTLIAAVRGSAWIAHDDGAPTVLGTGDVAIVRGPRPYGVADDPGTAPQVVIHPGQVCTTMDGTDAMQAMDLGVRTWGNSAEGSTVLLTGTYQTAGEASRRVLDALPEVVVVRATDWDSPLVALLSTEIVKDEPGQTVVLDRLLDLLLLAALREWFARAEARPPSWYQASSDPTVGRALQLIHHHPEHDWTVASLAAEAGVSRAALARRFHDLVGEPPIGYLTSWRLALAADLLLQPEATVTRVAADVGYGSPFTFSTAFKRAYGVSPREHRRAGSVARRPAG